LGVNTIILARRSEESGRRVRRPIRSHCRTRSAIDCFVIEAREASVAICVPFRIHVARHRHVGHPQSGKTLFVDDADDAVLNLRAALKRRRPVLDQRQS
jgi:hypothetical protein